MSKSSKRTKFINQVEKFIDFYRFLKPLVSKYDEKTKVIIQTKPKAYSIDFYYDGEILIGIFDETGWRYEIIKTTFRKLKTIFGGELNEN